MIYTLPYMSFRNDGEEERTHWIGSFAVALRDAAVCAGGRGDGERHVVVCEVLPQQQGLLVLLPRQTVAVVVDFERLTPGNRGVI